MTDRPGADHFVLAVAGKLGIGGVGRHQAGSSQEWQDRPDRLTKPQQCVNAFNGEEALEEIGDDPPDLVITDIRMPGMDGYELVRKLKERSPETPVLAISGYVSDADIVDYEFDAFLEKPMNPKEFS
ncbi:MAG: response regulator [Candidatus Latescibacterota bacterium]